MADTEQDSKTEEATGKHLSEAMGRGQFAKAPELQVLFVIAAVLGVLVLTTRTISSDVAEYSVSIFTRFGSIPVTRDTVGVQLIEVMMVIGKALVPVLLACVCAVVIAGGLQSGFQLTPEAFGFKPEALNPIPGFARVFSKAALVHAGIDLLKLVAIGSVLFLGAKALLNDPLFSAPVEAAYLAQFLNHATVVFMSRLLFALGIVTAISYGYEKFKTAKDLMMTKEEVKEEGKQAEGNPLIKGAMRRMARRMSQKQMLDAVATADVIVTNPTHFAVALKYERGKDKAPIVLAKGENQFARRIKALAAEHGVPMVENRPVARLLFSMGKVGETIPSELYQAVAEILAVVYRTHRYYFHRLKTRRVESAS